MGIYIMSFHVCLSEVIVGIREAGERILELSTDQIGPNRINLLEGGEQGARNQIIVTVVKHLYDKQFFFLGVHLS